MPDLATELPTWDRTDVHRFRAMACQITVQLVGAEPEEAADAFRTVEEIFRETESSCTRFDPASPLMTANGAPRRYHAVPSRCFDAILEAYDAYCVTGGLFDPRVLGSLESLGYDRSLAFDTGDVRIEVPAGTTTSDPVVHPWLPRFREATGSVRLGPRRIDLGGIGKGLAVRWAMSALRSHGTAALVEAGGDLATRGSGPEGTGWRAAVENPLVPGRAAHREPIAVIDASDRAVATSSVRLRHWQVGGREVHHLIDPATGRPAASRLAAVTVIHEDPAWAEVWSKSLFVAGAADIGALAESHALAAIWVDSSGGISVSPAADTRVIWQVSDAGS
ncbi:FAD:protein FMN transferase [Nakamurella sp. PAMC28650]|uniref:FAD:protein FMN transferase n=1 Tax=Nakamurella sp. PAMC28650 TaxID=2762325 RepID=UPI00164DDCD7|nr:FAD:protein FMN transferase [Nakamurella sp. PAMC28650]QNK80324.1 FAD:protein FMN transferase [Nakamurella sp. PAMC28650]